MKIHEYVLDNNIKTQKQILVMMNRLSCPYFDGKKCLIYEVRPSICQEFYCYKKPSMKFAENLKKDKYVTVNMWGIAEEIEKQRKELEHARKTKSL